MGGGKREEESKCSSFSHSVGRELLSTDTFIISLEDAADLLSAISS